MKESPEKNAPCAPGAPLLSRRHFLSRSSLGLGALGLASILDGRLFAAASQPSPLGGLPGLPHFPAKAKRVIYLFQSGGPSQLDLFDPKPNLNAFFDKDLPDSVRMGQRITGMT